MSTGPLIAFATRRRAEAPLEVRVNFGMVAGREATAAEIDELAHALQPAVGDVSIVAEERHEIGPHSEALVHQIVIEVAPDHVPAGDAEAEALSSRLVEEAVRWVDSCAADRHVPIV